MRAVLAFLVVFVCLAVPGAASADLFDPVTLDDAGAPGASAPKLAVDPTTGRGAGLWIRGTGTDARIVLRRRAPDGTFDSEIVVPEAAGAGARDADVAAGADGTIAVAYVLDDGTDLFIKTVTLAPGSDAPATDAIGDGGSDTLPPAVVIGNGGETTVAYREGSVINVRTRANPDVPFESPVPVSGATTPSALDFERGGEHQTVVWNEGPTLKARTRIGALSDFDDEQIIAQADPPTSGPPNSPRVAVTSEGVSVVAFQQPEAGLDRAKRSSRAFGPDQTWSQPEQISDAGQNGFSPKPVAAGTAAMIVFKQGGATPANDIVRVRTETSPAAPVPPGVTTQTVSSTPGVFGVPDIAADANGNAIAGWLRQGQLELALRPSLGEPFAASQTVEAASAFPVVGVGPSGQGQGTASALWLFGNDPATFGVKAVSGTTTSSGGGSPDAAFDAAAYPASESASGTITIRRPGGGGPATLRLRNTGGTATADDDYGLFGETTVNFAEGQDVISFPLFIRQDTVDEPNETIEYTIDNPTGDVAIGSQATTTVTIADDDEPATPTPPTVSIEDASVTEGSDFSQGARVARPVVRLSAPTSQTVRVNLQTENGSARAFADFAPRQQRLEIPPNTTTFQPEIPIVPDSDDEPDETFTVGLSNPENATVGRTPATVTIRDDDEPAPSTGGGSSGGGSPSGGGGAPPNPAPPPSIVEIPLAPLPSGEPTRVEGFLRNSKECKRANGRAGYCSESDIRAAFRRLKLRGVELRFKATSSVPDKYKDSVDEGEVVGQFEFGASGKRGSVKNVDVPPYAGQPGSQPVPFEWDVYDPPYRRMTCDSAELRSELNQRPEWPGVTTGSGTGKRYGAQDLLKRVGCKLTIQRVKRAGTSAPVIDRIDGGKGTATLTLKVPRTLELKVVTSDHSETGVAGVDREDGAMPVTNNGLGGMRVQVVQANSVPAELVDGARVTLYDGDGRFMDTATTRNGQAEVEGTFRSRGEGRVEVSRSVDGFSFDGEQRFAVKAAPSSYVTTSGRRMSRNGDNGFRAAAASAASRAAAAQAGCGQGGGHTPEDDYAIGTIMASFLRTASDVRETPERRGEALQAAQGYLDLVRYSPNLPSYIALSGVVPSELGAGRPGPLACDPPRLIDLNASAIFQTGTVQGQVKAYALQEGDVPTYSGNGFFIMPDGTIVSKVIASGGGNVIASGGGNVIASGGGNVIASGGGNVIASGGGNVIASGGGNFITGYGVIASGGGNVIASGGGNIIASGGGNVIASGGGNVIASGGGNVIASGGGN